MAEATTGAVLVEAPKWEPYIFNPQKFGQGTEKILASSKDFYKNWVVHGWDKPIEVEIAEMAARMSLDRAKLKRWAREFSGKVPKNWGVDDASSWLDINDDIREGVPLTDDQVAAAIKYPVELVPIALGENRPLTSFQLSLLAKQETMPPKEFDTIAERQKTMGTREEVVERARKINEWVWKRSR